MAMIAGPLLDIGGNAMLAESAMKHRKEFDELMDRLGRPDVGKLQKQYFSDLETYSPEAIKLTRSMREAELEGSLAMREKALPGVTRATNDAMASISPLLRGELPPSVMRAYQTAGGASTVGSGMGGSGFGFLNTGLFGARGSLGALQAGMGLLPSLLSTMPQISTPNPMALLWQGVMNPKDRSDLEMQLRQQQIGINNAYVNMPTRMDVWGTGMKQAGSMLMGGGFGGMGGGSSGGGSGMGGGGFGGFNSYGGNSVGGYGGGMNSGSIWGGGVTGGWNTSPQSGAWS